jgi:cysteinyl-tRNA synthetase
MAEKRNLTDFALWKFSPTDQTRQMEWDSPWGRGFPGWHIECSAMSAKYLGTFFDIHCGGEDHIPVHHTNEIAQTQACHGTHLANFWMHGYFLQLDDAKMAKSSGEFLTIQRLVDRGYDPLAYRYFCLNASYRAKLNFTWESLDGAGTALNRLRTLSHGWGKAGVPDNSYIQRFTSHVNNDLNMPQALALTWEMAKGDLPDATKKATLIEFDQVLGLKLADWSPIVDAIPEEIMALAQQRHQARLEKRWQDADQLRDQLMTAGYSVKDTPQGPQINLNG